MRASYPRNFRKIVRKIIVAVFIGGLSLCLGAKPAEAKKLRTALTGKFPPFSYCDAQGRLTGFDVDVSRAVARHMGKEAEIIATEWDGILAGLLTRKYDAVIGSMAITPERLKKVDFSVPYYESGAQLFIHRDNPDKIYSLAECSGLKIAVVLGETYQQFLERNYPEIEVVTFKSTVEIFEMLEQRRISGFVTDRLVGTWQIKTSSRPFVPVGKMLYSEKIGIPVCKDRPQLLQSINQALAGIKSSGTLKAIYNKYFGISVQTNANAAGMTLSTIIKKLLKGFAVTLFVAFSSIAAGFALAIPAGLLLADPQGKWRLPGMLVRGFVDLIRGTPVLIQLLFVWLGLNLSPFPAAITTLGVCAMAYMAEAVRSGLISVDPGQNSAARALGLSKFDSFRFVIWPQAFRIALPTLMNSVVALIKDTALISVISIPELVREAQSIISVTFEPRKYYLIAALMFFVITFPLMKIAGNLEKRIKEKGFQND
ncbi:MAG: ABC transporter substrate-binding protein/permease [Victivallales bacterium]|nr:ABC transporter substrate-binding protein/permease [Victivallales bacterium]